MTKTDLLNRCARNGEERLLYARVLDKLEFHQKRGLLAHSPFLSPGEQLGVSAMLKLSGPCRHVLWGGFDDAERKICLFYPDWQEPEDIYADPDGPLTALEVTLPEAGNLSHRDILGSLMGLGITREHIGDILIEAGRCQVVVLSQSATILLSQWSGAGRYPLSPIQVPLSQIAPKPPQVATIRDTVQTLRLDAVTASGFSISRGKAADLIQSGRVNLNHQACVKPDRQVAQGDVLSCRGLGKCVVAQVLGQSKKGRTMLVLERYI